MVLKIFINYWGVFHVSPEILRYSSQRKMQLSSPPLEYGLDLGTHFQGKTVTLQWRNPGVTP